MNKSKSIMRFSQRIGKSNIKTVLQIESIDGYLQNRLWNTILEAFFERLSNSNYAGTETQRGETCKEIWKEFFGFTVDTCPSHGRGGVVDVNEAVAYFRKWFFAAEWFEAYDFVEFLARLDLQMGDGSFVDDCNEALRKEVAGYRIIGENIVQITTEEEVQEIEEAISSCDEWKSVNTHLHAALDLLSDRKTPDYRNSIKESISAVEAYCKIITGDSTATLGKALAEIEKRHQLHGALKAAFSALYGYSSDAGGIRHALVDASIQIEFEDAKFMLVSCSAFINYLKAKIKI